MGSSKLQKPSARIEMPWLAAVCRSTRARACSFSTPILLSYTIRYTIVHYDKLYYTIIPTIIYHSIRAINNISPKSPPTSEGFTPIEVLLMSPTCPSFAESEQHCFCRQQHELQRTLGVLCFSRDCIEFKQLYLLARAFAASSVLRNVLVTGKKVRLLRATLHALFL